MGKIKKRTGNVLILSKGSIRRTYPDPLTLLPSRYSIFIVSKETFYFHLYILYIALPTKNKQKIEFSSFCIQKITIARAGITQLIEHGPMHLRLQV